MSKRVRHWSLFWATWIQLGRLCCPSLVPLISRHQRRGFRNRLFHLRFQTTMYVCISDSPLILSFFYLSGSKYPLHFFCPSTASLRCTWEQVLPNPGSRTKLGSREPSDGGHELSKLWNMQLSLFCNVTLFKKDTVKRSWEIVTKFYFNSGRWPTWRTISSITCLLESSTFFEQLCAHLQEDNCIHTAVLLRMSTELLEKCRGFK
jgi:hypothetical protein